MNEYDTTLKVLLQRSTGAALLQVTRGMDVTTWLTSEFPQVQMRRADLVGATEDGQLVHIELQSTNDRDMALRMIEYAIGTYRNFSKLPVQIVLYVGEAPLRMPASLRGPDPLNPNLDFRFTLVDFRDLDGNTLLASDRVEDNILAILTRLQNKIGTVRQILERIAGLEASSRRMLFAHFCYSQD